MHEFTNIFDARFDAVKLKVIKFLHKLCVSESEREQKIRNGFPGVQNLRKDERQINDLKPQVTSNNLKFRSCSTVNILGLNYKDC
jgi:hypothetical protein